VSREPRGFAESGIAQRICRLFPLRPDVCCPDQSGETVRLSTLLGRGLWLSLYRAGEAVALTA